ncbi:hypothetical protein QBC37DRAFT_240851, partial [Rhypophila decipiens]
IRVPEEAGKLPRAPLGSLYLINWASLTKGGYSIIRESEGSSIDIYRHPQMHGGTIQVNMGHDIYSLGVCLLEIGLWQSFVRPDGSSRLTRRQDGALRFSRRLTYSQIKDNFVKLASKQLPLTMGESYAHLVKACLTCLDPPNENEPEIWRWGGHDFSRLDRELDCQAFRKQVLGFLWDVN